MNQLELRKRAKALVARPKGILAADESIATMSKRLQAVGVPASASSRRDYRELIVTTPRLNQFISGIIFCDETIRQTLFDGTPFPRACSKRGIQVGIKVDTGTVPLARGEAATVTEGLDGLRGRLEEYRALGATFAKWRAVVDPENPSMRAIRANAHALARYASLCQEADIVPIVEPEVLMEGEHDPRLSFVVTSLVLAEVFAELHAQGVDPAGMILKPNMVLEGTASSVHADPDQVAEETLTVLNASVPPSLAGIAFLSGGQSNERACANLAAINQKATDSARPTWPLTFSFGRALIQDALDTWRGRPAAVYEAQDVLASNCARASAAREIRQSSHGFAVTSVEVTS